MCTKHFFAGFVLMASLLTAPLFAQSAPPSASTEIYSWSAFNQKALLELFYTALQQGRKYPTQSEIDALGFDLEFARSHVRPASIIVDQASQVKPAIHPKRKLWLNTPVGVGKMIGGIRSRTGATKLLPCGPILLCREAGIMVGFRLRALM